MRLIHDLDDVNYERARLLCRGQLEVAANQLDGDTQGITFFALF